MQFLLKVNLNGILKNCEIKIKSHCLIGKNKTLGTKLGKNKTFGIIRIIHSRLLTDEFQIIFCKFELC